MTTEYKYEYPLPVGHPDEGGEADVVFVYTVTWGHPAVMYLSNGDPGYPAEPDEIELVRVDVVGESRPYRKNDTPDAIEQAAHDAFYEDDDDLYVQLIENARDADEYERDAAAEHAAEARREIRREERE